MRENVNDRGSGVGGIVCDQLAESSTNVAIQVGQISSNTHIDMLFEAAELQEVEQPQPSPKLEQDIDEQNSPMHLSHAPKSESGYS